MKKSKLNISQLHWGYPPIIGGVETHLAMILPEMVKAGHQVSLLTGSVDSQKSDYEENNVRINRSPLLDLNWLFKRGLDGIKDEFKVLLNKFVEKNKPDIMHVHNMHYFSRPHAEILQDVCQQKGVPIILTAHNVWDEVLFLELTRNIQWDHVIAVSHYIRKEMICAGCATDQVSTIHHGVDHNLFSPQTSADSAYKWYPQLKGRQVVFHPARMGLAKGCDVSIKALNIIRRHFPNVLMVLAGTKNIIDWGEKQQKDIAYFVDLVRHFRLEENVLIDVYALNQMPHLYAASNIVIYPSTAMEPFGLIMLEGMATAKPLVVTRAGGMPEIVHDGINGFVVPIKDFEELAGAVMRLLGDQELSQRFGFTGRQEVESYYTKEAVTKNTLAIYDKVLNG